MALCKLHRSNEHQGTGFAPLHLHEKEKASGVGVISKILIIADASKEALDSVLEAFQGIRKSQPKVKGFFISCLSEPFLKHLGPNILGILLKQEKETLEAANDYFNHMDIPRHFEILVLPPFQAILDEIKGGDIDLIILQGEFLKISREKNLIKESRLHAVTSKCPMLIIHESERPSPSVYFRDSETLSTEGSSSI